MHSVSVSRSSRATKWLVAFAVLSVLPVPWLLLPEYARGSHSSVGEQLLLSACTVALPLIDIGGRLLDLFGIMDYLHATRLLGEIAIGDIWSNLIRVLAQVNIKSIDTTFDGVPVRIYIPLDSTSIIKPGKEGRPGMLFIHGGGWAHMSIQTHDRPARLMANTLGAVLVSVNFRLAPEHQHPAPIDDCETALRYFMRNARTWGVDPTRIGVTGESSGSHLSAVIAQRWARKYAAASVSEVSEQHSDIDAESASQTNGVQLEEQLPNIKVQFLISPPLQFVNFTTYSYVTNTRSLLSADMMMFTSLSALLLGESYANNMTFLRALSANNHTTSVSRARFAAIFDQVASFRDPADLASANAIRSQLMRPLALNKDNSSLEGTEFASTRKGASIPVSPGSPATVSSKLLAPPLEGTGLLSEGDPEFERQYLHLFVDPEISPLLAPESAFRGLANCYMMSAEHDTFMDEDLLYVKRLRDSGHVALVGHKHYSDKYHGFFWMDPSVVIDDFAQWAADNNAL